MPPPVGQPGGMVLGMPWASHVLPPWMAQFGVRSPGPMMHPFPVVPNMSSPSMPSHPAPYLVAMSASQSQPEGVSHRRLSPNIRQTQPDYSSSSESDPSSPNPSRTKPAKQPVSPMDNSKLLALALATGAGFIPPPTAGGPVQLEIYHKPRGSQGEWKLVYHGQNLRVTKQRGKLVRLVVRSTTRYDWDACRVKLLIRSGDDEIAEDGEVRPRWIESTAREALAVDKRQVTEERDPDNRGNTVYVHQLAVKVFPTRSTLAFRVECSPIDQPNDRLVCTSVEMHTHDSGRRD